MIITTNKHKVHGSWRSSGHVGKCCAGGCFIRGWFQNTRCRLKQHGKRHRCNTDAACNHMFFEATPFETTPYETFPDVSQTPPTPRYRITCY